MSRFAGARRGGLVVALASLLLAHPPVFAQQDTAGDTERAAGAAEAAGASEAADIATPAADGSAADAAPAPASDPSSGGVRRVPDGVAEAKPGSGSDYPTVARADYVLGCMAANGNDYQALQQCSCSIDYIRERMDWASYERANTVLQVQLDRGQRGIFYRDSNWAKSRVDRLQALQAESSLRCF